MKNLHIIATDKPSLGKYLVFNKEGNLCIWETNTMGSQRRLLRQNIYITSDVEIKEGDWIYYTLASGYCKTTVSSKGLKQKGIPAKKIILTTDLDLINNGVQAIDDEFLEWFVKNPNCEEVEVTPLRKSSGYYDEKDIWHWDFLAYKIIIPKEEPKHIPYTGKVWEPPKQETLEEAALRLYPRLINDSYNPMEDDNEEDRNIWIKGAKWQEEKVLNGKKKKCIVRKI